MNFKRFISGVSAFAVASSVFAGLAVTASAEMNTLYTQDFENLDGNVEGWTTNASRYPLSIQNDAGTGEINDYLAAIHADQNNGATITSPSYASYITAGVTYSVSMDIKLGGCNPNSSNDSDKGRKSVFSINTLSDPPSNYLLQLAGDTPDTYGSNPYWIINEDAGMMINLPGTNHCRYNLITDNDSHPWYHIEVTYDNDTQKEYLTITDKATGAYAKLTDGETEVNNLEIPVKMSNAQVSNITYDTNRYWAGFAIDNLKIDAEAPEPAESVTIKFQSTDGTTIKTIGPVDISGDDYYIGSAYIYNIPAFINYNGTLYEAKDLGTFNFNGNNHTDYQKQANLTDVSTEITDTTKYEKVEAVDDVWQYEEYDGNKCNVLERSRGFSNGELKNIGMELTPVLTVTKDGKYDVRIAIGGTNARGGSPVDKHAVISVNDEEHVLGTVQYSNRPIDEVYTGINLKAGDKIMVKGDHEQIGVDFVLITKTADLPTTRDEGFKFQITSIEEAKKYSTLVIKGTEGEDPKSDEVDITEKLSSLTGGGDVSLGVLLKGLPEDVKITSITLK